MAKEIVAANAGEPGGQRGQARAAGVFAKLAKLLKKFVGREQADHGLIHKPQLLWQRLDPEEVRWRVETCNLVEDIRQKCRTILAGSGSEHWQRNVRVREVLAQHF